MRTRLGWVAAALVVVACTEGVGPGMPSYSFSPNGITLSRVNGSLNESGTQLAKGFDPKNPHLGDAVIATFYWLGSTYIVDSVIDFVADANNTRAGNQYHLVEYVTAGGYSMATYVATNVRNFPDTSSTAGQILAVRAYLNTAVTDGGIRISSWTGVEDNFATALGEHRSATGSDSTMTAAHAGPITVGTGAVAYSVTMSGLFGLDGPQNGQGYTSLGQGSDNSIKEEGAYRVFPAGGTTDPQWTWFYGPARGTWLVTTLALNPGTSSTNQPPTAAFTSSCTNLTCSFTNTSSDPDGSIASNSWNFGDGTTSTVASPSHSYTAAGTYNVTLTVTDNQGATNSVLHSVTVSQANQSPTAAFTSSCTNLTCTFTNGSSDPDGSITGNSWNFGDGTTSTVASPSHSYTAAGTYNVTLTVTDNQGATGSVSHSVTVSPANQAPTANFTFSCNALTCGFTSTSSDPDGSIASYSWNFGDGATSTAQNPSHAYAAGGSYTVTLRVTDNQGAQSPVTSKTVTVTAPNQLPVASFTKSCSGLTCTFTSTSSDPDGSIASYSWNFGDGGTSTLQNPSHTYAAGGTYTVTLTVTDNRGGTNSTSQSVTVTPPNQAPVVNAGPDQTVLLGVLYTLNASFSDPDNGPWTYQVDWGDGSTSTGSRSAAGSFSLTHTYLGLSILGTRTIRVTITDSRGASGSDTKNVTIVLL